MAGRGPAPKDPSRLVGHGSRKRRQCELRVVCVQPAAQPPLPEDVDWPDATRIWWRKWGQHPLAATFTEVDWSQLVDAALLHARLWSGQVSVAPELRLRMAKFGATPEDRARLRIHFSWVGVKHGTPQPLARDRRGPRTTG